MFLINKASIGFQLESVPYVYEAPTELAVRVMNLTYNVEAEEFRKKILDETLDYERSVMGKSMGSFSFDVPLAPGATVTTDPEFNELLQASGFRRTLYAATGIGWNLDSRNTHTPMSIVIQENADGADPADQLVFAFSGVMFELTLKVGKIGEPVLLNFAGRGTIASVADKTTGQLPENFQTTDSPAFLGAVVNLVDSTPTTFPQDISTFEIKTNNDLQDWDDPANTAGWIGTYIAGRQPTLGFDPSMKLISVEDVYQRMIDGDTFHVDIDLDTIHIDIQAAQTISASPAGRNGARIWEKQFLLTKDPTTRHNALEILQGSKT